MKRCPKCNCGAEFTNSVEYYAKHTGATVAGLGAGFITGLFNPNYGGAAANQVRKNLTENVRKIFKCTNSNCGYEWYE